MRVEIQRCDFCGKQVSNYTDEGGWVHIEGKETAISVMKGRDENGYVHSYHHTLFNGELDFCSIMCFEKWLIAKDENKDEDKK